MATKQVAEAQVAQAEPEDEYTSHLQNLAEVATALSVRLPEDKLRKVPGSGGKTYDYVPWETTANELDRIFGPFGWSESITKTHFDSERGIYAITRELVGYVRNRGGVPVSIRREATGRAIASGQDARAHDTAIAAADSDSFSRVAKKLGDAFGRYLYDKNDPANAATPARPRPAATGTVSGGPKDFRPSEKQLAVLVKNGVPAAAVQNMPFGQWKPLLDSIFNGTFQGYEPTEDEIPF